MRKLTQSRLIRLRCAGLILSLILIGAACSPQPVPPTAAPSATAPAAAPTDTAAPSPTQMSTSAPAPTDTPAATNTPAPSNTPETTPAEPTTRATGAATGTAVPTGTPVLPLQPELNGVTFQIRNNTNNILYVFGYGVSKSIPSGMTVYFQAPAWGSIELRICHKNKNDEVGGCYLYTGTISASQPLIMVRR